MDKLRVVHPTRLTLQQASGSSVSLQLDTEQATARSGYAGQLEAQWLF